MVSRQYIYRPPTKLWEGNIFSYVYLSVILSTVGSHVTITHDELESTIQGVRSPQAPPMDVGCHCTGIPGPRP